MSILTRVKNIATAIRRSVAAYSLATNGEWLRELFGRPTLSKVLVTESTADSVTAYNRAVTVLSEAVAKLPFEIFRIEGSGRVLESSHPVARLLNVAPSDFQTPFLFYTRIVNALMKKGNSYHFIQRDEQGRPVALLDLNSVTVQPMFVEVDGTKALMYKIDNESQLYFQSDIFHVVGWGDSPYEGKNPIRVHAETLGLAIAITDTEAALFGNRAQIGGVLETEMQASAEQRKDIAESWTRNYSGAENAGKVAVLSHGYKYRPIALNPVDSRLLESKDFQIDEVARITGVPPHKLFKLSDSTISNMEVMNAGFVETVDSICVRIEQEARRKLFAAAERDSMMVRANLYEIARGDMASRAAYFHSMLQDGVLSLNEVRTAEGFVRIGAGDVYYRPLNMTTVNADGSIAFDPNAQGGNGEP